MAAQFSRRISIFTFLRGWAKIAELMVKEFSNKDAIERRQRFRVIGGRPHGGQVPAI